jgi:hypothetical protein
MSRRCLKSTFAHESELLSATAAVRRRGWKIADVHTPYAVHGLDTALGLPPSRLTWVCFVCGMLGALGMLWLEHWTMAVDWPVNVGGKPWNSLPSDVPVAFEAAVLLAGFGSVLAMFAVCRLYPGKAARITDRRQTNDRFVILIEEDNAAVEFAAVAQFLKQHGAIETTELILDEGAP